MPDESCRKYGGLLVRCSICVECRQTIQSICFKCGARPLEQIHDKCFLAFEIKTSKPCALA